MNRRVKSKSGSRLTTQEEQLKRWEEHFSEIFKKDDNSVGSEQEIEDDSENESETEVNVGPSYKN